MSEVPFIIALLAGLYAWTFFLTGKARIFWNVVMGIIALVVVGGEIAGTVMYGKTISRMYWEWSVDHVSTHWVVMGMMMCGWIALLWHLSAKVIDKMLEKKKE